MGEITMQMTLIISYLGDKQIMTKIKSMIINILSTYKLIIFLLIIDTKNMQEDISSSRKKIPTFDVIEVPESELKKESLLEKGYHDRQQIMIERNIQQAREREMYLKLRDKSFVVDKADVPKIEQWLSQLDRKYIAIRPQSTFLLVWNFTVLFATLFHIFQIPIAIFLTERVYVSERDTAAGLLINFFTILILTLDIPIRFNIAYYQKGKLIQSRLIIFKKYIKYQFWIDLGCLIIIIIYLGSGTQAFVYFKILYYLKLTSIYKIDRDILHRLQMSRIPYALYRLMRLFILLFFITTWIAAIFFAIDFYYYELQGYYYQKNQLWLTNSAAVGSLNIITNFPWYVWFQYALYWSFQTSSTVGYGDLTPQNPPEVLYCNLVILLMTVLFAFFINSIWQIIGQLQESSIDYSENWRNLKIFLRNSKIPRDVKERISNYLYEVWMDDENDEIQKIINSMLSPQLKNQFYLTSKSKFFQKLPIFNIMKDSCPQMKMLLQELVYLIRQQNYLDGQMIYQEGKINQVLYFVKKGKVKLFVKDTILGKQVTTDKTFGEWEFLTQSLRTHSAESVTFCKIWKLTFVDFKKCLHRYNFLYQKYSQLISDLIFENKVTLVNERCWNCKSDEHWFRFCGNIVGWKKRIRIRSREGIKFMELMQKQRDSKLSNATFKSQMSQFTQFYAENGREEYTRSKARSSKFKGLQVDKSYLNVEIVFKMHYYNNHFNASDK